MTGVSGYMLGDGAWCCACDVFEDYRDGALTAATGRCAACGCNAADHLRAVVLAPYPTA